MKSIMISIQPQWVEKILNGEKTIEIRKTKPSCELPVKVYVYCTNNKKHMVAPFRFVEGWRYKKYDDTTNYANGCTANIGEDINGKVCAEFTLNEIQEIYYTDICGANYYDEDYLMPAGRENCLTAEQLLEYGKKDTLYGWCIDNLKIYDKPKLLQEFFKPCEGCDKLGTDRCTEEISYCRAKVLRKPPQSWCYCEGLEN